MYREKHTEVSEFLGVTYRHLLYVLADFVKRGYLKKQNKAITFRIWMPSVIYQKLLNHIFNHNKNGRKLTKSSAYGETKED